MILYIFFFFSSRRRHTRLQGDWIQTCALPIFTREGVKIITGTFSSRLCGAASEAAARHTVIYWETSCVDPRFNKRGQIGRASCRERVESSVVAGSLKEKEWV